MIASRTAQANGPSATILVADADPERAQRLRAVLERAGYRVISAADGAATLRLLPAHTSDLVLCDAALPDLDGFDVCRAIKQAPATRDTPVVLMVDPDDEVQHDRALQAGADDIAPKPVEPAALIAVVRAQLRIARLTTQLNDLEGVVVTLARAVEDRDHASGGLSEKVAHWAMQLGAAIELPDDQLTLLYKAALLHDVGTLSVPVAVLAKEGRLDPSEFGQVKRHPVVSAEILSALPRSEELLPAVRHHHERIDGAGYPDGLGGDEIPLFARIIAIADAFVAMTNDRPYRRRRTKADAIRTLSQGAGKQWDASLVEQFLQLVAKTDAETLPGVRTAG